MFLGDIFDPFSKVRDRHLKIKEHEVWIDNWIYLLHRKWSCLFSMIALTIIFSYPAMIDQPIVCFGPKSDEVPKDFLNEWCWVSGTYIVPEHIGKSVGKEVPHSGVGPDDLVNGTTTRLYHNQYIFYPFIFLLQTISFFASTHIWKYLEGGRLKNLLSELTEAIIDEETWKNRINLVTDYMTTSPATFHTKYAWRYIFCELFNGFNIIFQFWAINKVLHGEFFSFGSDALAYIKFLNGPNASPLTIKDPFTRLFPKLAICHFKKVGPSGNIIPLEALCVLPLNNIADKIFLFWWFWLLCLMVITSIGLIYRCVLIFSKGARLFFLRLKSGGCEYTHLKYLVEHSTYGDWFVLSMMNKNMDSWIFSQLVRSLVTKMKETRQKIL